MNDLSQSADPINQAAYNEVAEKWFRSHSWFINDDEYPELLSFFERLNGKAKSRVLDIGCGYGRHFSCIESSEVEYTGIDIAEKMIECAQWLNPRGRFKQMSYNRLEFEEHSFDGFLCLMALHHERKSLVVQSLSSIRRVMKSGGPGYITVPDGETEFDINCGFESINRAHGSGYSREEFGSKLIEAGFKILSARTRPCQGSPYELSHEFHVTA